MEIDYNMRKLFNEEYLTQVAYMYNNMPRGLLGPHFTEYGLRIAVYLPQCPFTTKEVSPSAGRFV